jgi:hypothetical protein
MILGRRRHDVGKVDGSLPEVDLSLTDPRHIEQVVEQLAEMVRLAANDLPYLDRPRFRGVGLIQHLNPVEDHAERVAKFVREHIQELILRAVGRFRFGPRGLLPREHRLPSSLALLFRQVRDHQADVRRSPSKPARGDLGRDLCPIGRSQHGLEPSRASRKQPFKFRLVRDYDELTHRKSDESFQSHPDHVLKAAIAVEDVALWREHDRALLHLLDDSPIRLVSIDDGVDLWAGGSLNDNRVHFSADIVQRLLSCA